VYAEHVPGQYAGRMVRIGSYGDPAAVPLQVWEDYTRGAAGVTGYTHQWRDADAAGLGRYCMASCDTAGERIEAVAAGWRTFRVRVQGEDKLPGEAVCPASHEAGQLLTCDQCKSCNGNLTGRIGGIVIEAHGSKAKINAFKALRVAG